MTRHRPGILVIRRDNIGDLVCTTPLIDALRSHFPDAYLAALANSYNAGVLRGNPALNAVFAYTKLKHRPPGQGTFAALWQRLRLIRELRRLRFDFVILAKSGFDAHGLRFARQIGARRIVGFSDPQRPESSAINLHVPSPAGPLQHEVEVLFRLLEPLGFTAVPGPLRVFPEAVRAAAFRRRLGSVADCRWIALHISAREAPRQWAAEKFIALIERLRNRTDLGFVLLWSPGPQDDPRHPGDDGKARKILDAQSCPRLVALPTGELDDLVAALSVCDLFVGSDGGALHIAAGLGKPVAGLFENTEYKTKHWYPWQVPHEVIVAETFAVGDIAVDQVAAAIERLLKTI